MPEDVTQKVIPIMNSGEYTGKSFTDNEGRELFTFVITSRSLDRTNEIVDTTTLKVESFKKNSRMYYQHDRWRSTIGEWFNVRMEGSVWLADAYFHCLDDITSGEPISARVKQYVQTGQLKTASIGFSHSTVTILPVTDGVVRLPDGMVVPIPSNRTERIMSSWDRGVKYHQNAELLEISIVDIPANADAVAKILAFNEELETKIGKPISGSNFQKIKSAKLHSDECSKALKELAEAIGEIIDDDEDNDTIGHDDDQAKPESKSVPDNLPLNELLDKLKAELLADFQAKHDKVLKTIEPLTSDLALRKLKLKHNL